MSDDVPTRLDRIVCGDASTADWDVVIARGEADPGVYRALAHALRGQQALGAGIADALRGVHAVGLPVTPAPARPARTPIRRLAPLAAAAALLLITWIAVRAPHAGGEGVRPGALAPAVAAPAGALAPDPEHVLPRARPFETPAPRILASRPLPGGAGIELVTLRPRLEHSIVRDAFQIEHDELGRPRRVPVEPELVLASESF